MSTHSDSFSGEKIFPVHGAVYFKLMETQNPVDVELRRAGGGRIGFLSQVEAGTRFECSGADKIAHVVITTASTESVKFFASDARGGNDAVVMRRERSVKFTASGVYVVPAGVNMLRALVISGGGGGGGGHNAAAGGGGGGGGASQPVSTLLFVTPGESLTITIGAGGSGGAAGSDGSNGSLSSIVRVSNGDSLAAPTIGTKGSKGTATAGGSGGGASGLLNGGTGGTGDGQAGTVIEPCPSLLGSTIGPFGAGGAGGGPSSTGGNGGSIFGTQRANGGANTGTDGGGGGGGLGCITGGPSGGAGQAAGTQSTARGSGGGGGGGQAAGAAGQDGLVIIEAL